MEEITRLYLNWLQNNPGPHYVMSNGQKILIKPRDYFDTVEMAIDDTFYQQSYHIYLDEEKVYLDPDMLSKHVGTPFYMLVQKELHLPNKDLVLDILYGVPPLCYSLFEFNDMYLNGTSEEIKSKYAQLIDLRGFCTLESAKSIQLLDIQGSIRDKHEFFFPHVFEPTDYNLDLQNKRQFAEVSQEVEIVGETHNIIRIPALLETMGFTLNTRDKIDIGKPIAQYIKNERYIDRHKMPGENFTFFVYYPSDVPDMMHPIKKWLLEYINKKLNGITINLEVLDKILEDTGTIPERISRLITFKTSD